MTFYLVFNEKTVLPNSEHGHLGRGTGLYKDLQGLHSTLLMMAHLTGLSLDPA